MTFSAGQSFKHDKLDLAGNSALILTKSAIAKNLLNQSLSENVACSVSFYMKNFYAIVIAVAF